MSLPEQARLYLSPPDMDDKDRAALMKAFDSGWIAPVGPVLNEFEAAVAKHLQNERRTIALSSGTAALHLALRVFEVERGDEVFVSTFTFAASAFAVCYLGATPVFIDSNERTWNLCPEILEKALRQKARANCLPKAVIVVDSYGQCADYVAIRAACDRYGVPIIQDAAESLGATHGEEPAGMQGDCAVFSFNGNKIITTSGGGMLVCRTSEQEKRARLLATQARLPAPHYEHHETGYNYRLSNLLAGLGVSQMARLHDKIAARREHFERYREALGDYPDVSFIPFGATGRPNYWLSSMIIASRENAMMPERLRLALEAENIESRPLWKPLHRQQAFAGCEAYLTDVSDRLFATGICLPSGSAMSAAQRDCVIETLQKGLQLEGVRVI